MSVAQGHPSSIARMRQGEGEVIDPNQSPSPPCSKRDKCSVLLFLQPAAGTTRGINGYHPSSREREPEPSRNVIQRTVHMVHARARMPLAPPHRLIGERRVPWIGTPDLLLPPLSWSGREDRIGYACSPAPLVVFNLRSEVLGPRNIITSLS